MHIIPPKLISSKVPIFQGKEAKNNELVLKTVALNGFLIKYDVFKELKKTGLKYYPTVSRRIDNLLERGYLHITGTRQTRVGNRTEESKTYGLTPRGIIASLCIQEVRAKILDVLEKNQVFDVASSRSSIERMIIRIIKNLFDQKELDDLLSCLLDSFLKAIPETLESLKDEEYVAYIVPALFKLPEDVQGILRTKDFSDIMKIEGFPEFIFGIIENYEDKLKQTLEFLDKAKKHLALYVSEPQNLEQQGIPQ